MSATQGREASLAYQHAALEDGSAPQFMLSTMEHDAYDGKIVSVDCQNDTLAVLHESGDLTLSDVQQGHVIAKFSVRNPNKVFVHPSGTFVAACAADGEVVLYSAYDRRALSSVLLPPLPNSIGSRVAVAACLCWLPAGERYPVAGGWSAVEGGLGKKGAKGSVDEGDDVVRCLIGTNAGGVVYGVTFRTGSGSGQAPAKAAVSCVWQLPPLASGRVRLSSVALSRTATGIVLAASTATALFYALCWDTGVSFESFLGDVQGDKIPVECRAMTAVHDGSPISEGEDASAASLAPGQLLLYASSVSSVSQSYVWCSAGGLLHGAFSKPAGSDVANANERLLFVEREKKLEGEVIDVARAAEAALQWERARSGAGTESANAGSSFPTAPPLLVVPTAFHMILVYPRRCVVLGHAPGLPWRPCPLQGNSGGSQGDERTAAAELKARVRFDPFRDSPPTSPFLGAVRDAVTRRVILFSASQLYQLEAEMEHQQQWRCFLARANAAGSGLSLAMRKRLYDAAFNLAWPYPGPRNLVQHLRGLFLVECGAADHGTSVLAEGDWFADSYGALLKLRNPALLAQFVAKRYDHLTRHLSPVSAWQPQLGILATMTVQHKLDALARAASASPQLAETAEADLATFLHQVAAEYGDGDAGVALYRTVVGLLVEQGQEACVLDFSRQMRRPHLAVSYYCSHANYSEAVKALSQCPGRTAEDKALWYEFVPLLVERQPIALVTALLRLFSRETHAGNDVPLEVERLLPAFTRYTIACNEEEDNTEHQIVVLLEQSIHRFNCVAESVHNYFLELLVDTTDAERLDDFLSTSFFYDIGFALRRCLCGGPACVGACVNLYKRLHLYRDAVSAALHAFPPPANDDAAVHETSEEAEYGGWRQGLVLAQDMLRGIRDKVGDTELRSLWMMVADYVLRTGNTRATLAVVESSGGVLQLEDVLGSISDKVVVRELKEAICSCFDGYSAATAVMTRRQEDAFHTAEGIKRDLLQTRQHFGLITATQRCLLCHGPLLQISQPYLIYPTCRHVVHEACAVKRLEAMGGVEAFLADESISPHVVDGVTDVRDLAERDCVICGEAAIVEVDAPLCVAGGARSGASGSWALA